MSEIIEILKAIFLGIVEGITEWLPISSTGHMILVDEFLKLRVSEEFKEMFLVVIQLGAILAVAVVFFKRLFPFSKKNTKEENAKILRLWLKVVIGVVPVGILGVLLDDFLDEHLYNYVTVAVTLIVYGVAFILVEHFKKEKHPRVESVYDIGYKDALIIGSFQILSLIPGTSRSGSTILGGMLNGVSRAASAEFSFYLAIPVMAGASLLKVLKLVSEGTAVGSLEIWLLIVGMLVAFLVSLFVIKFLMSFVERHDLKVFGYYRIVLGLVVVVYFLTR